ncbi:phage tail tape measure protein [Streptomyces sp. NPDC088353]|uniref:phage tail tape measure protein n=1 Tax=Streptomyces sp. NPDC088353 TaxID=3365855 RepID=UPI0038002DB6
MASTVGYGVLQIMPSMRGIDAAIRRQMGTPAVRQAASDAGRDAGSNFASGLGKSGTAMKDTGTKLSTWVTAPVAALGIGVIKTAGDFETGMNKVKAVSGATGGEFTQLRDLAKELGATTRYSATEAADGMSFLAMTGFKAKDIMTALPGVLDLAAAGNIGLAEAADIASNILSGYGMKANEIGRVNDALAKTFTSANVDMTMLGESMKYVAPVASSLGVEFEETTAAIGLLGNAGIQGSQAGTTLRMALARLASPPKAAAAALKDLGIEVNDSKGKMRPLVDIIAQLEKKGASTTQMMKIFGIEAGPGMQAIVSQGSGALRSLTQDLRDSGGTAKQVAAVQMEGFNGAIINLKAAFEALAIEIGDSGILAWVTQFTDKITGLIRQVAAADPQIFKIGTVVALVAALVGPLLVGLGFAISGIGTALAFLLSPVGAVIAGVALLAAGLGLAYATSQPFRDFVNDLAGRLRAGLVDAFDAVKQAVVERLLPALQGMWDKFTTKVLPAISELAQTVLPKALAIFKKLGVLLTGTVLPILADVGGFLMAYVIPPVLTVAKYVGGLLLDALSGVVSVGASVLGWLRDMGAWLAPVAVAVAGLTLVMNAQKITTALTTGVFRAYRAVILAWTGVQRIATAVQAAYNAVMAANPIGLVVIAIVALVAAIVVAYKKSDTFRSIVQACWEGIKTAAQFVWEKVLKPAFEGFMAALKAVGDAATWLWQTVLSPVFGFIAQAAKVLGIILLIVVFGPIILGVKVLAAIFTWLWDVAIKPAFDGIAAAAKWLWANALKPAFDAAKKGVDLLGKAFKWLYDNAVKPVFNGIKQAIGLWWSGVKLYFQAVRDYVIGPLGSVFKWLYDSVIKPVWDKIKSAISTAWNSAIKPAFDALKTAVGKIADAFGTAKDGIAKAWDKIRDAAKKPINWIIRVVWNQGIVPTWEKITGWIPGVPKLGKLKELAAGGTIGAGFGQPATPGIYNKPTAIVGEGRSAYPEFVIPTDPSFRGRALALWEAAGTQLLAKGGIIGDALGGLKKVGGKVVGGIKGAADFLTDPLGAAAKLLNPFIDKASAHLGTSAWGKMATGIPKALIKGLKDKIKKAVGELLGGGGGGAGPVGSGVKRWAPMVSQVLSMLGLPASALNAVLTRMNMESGGNPKAINLWDSNAKAGIPSKGLLQVIDPTFAAYAGPLHSRGIWDPLANTYAALNYATHRYPNNWIQVMTRPGGYDSGGLLPPGLSTVYNGTRRPEKVLTDQQWQAVMDGARGGEGTSYTINARTADFTVRDLELLQRRQDARARVGRPR